MQKYNNNEKHLCHFFYPQLKSIIDEEKSSLIEKELFEMDSNIFENFESKQKSGENDSHICCLIRQDLVKEFIIYVNQCNIQLNSQIKPSIFESNSFLIENNPTLIEYAAFYGSVEIFRYLEINQVKLSESLYFYSIHSNNSEIFSLVDENLSIKKKEDKKKDEENEDKEEEDIEEEDKEEKDKEEEDKEEEDKEEEDKEEEDKEEEDKEEEEDIMDNEEIFHSRCISEAIKCHHNELAFYLIENKLSVDNDDKKLNNIVREAVFDYANYTFFSYFDCDNFSFFCLCKNYYYILVELLIRYKFDNPNYNKIFNTILKSYCFHIII